MDSVSVSAGGRVAKIYMHRERQRKITSMMNGIEAKRLEVIKRQINDDKATERHLWERTSRNIFQSNDDIKAFQQALLRRISVVKEKSKLSGGIRPLLNLGRYGGATIDQIKTDSVKYKPIRNPEQRRMIKTRILLEQGKRMGKIKTFESNVLGDITESILQLEKVAKPPDQLRRNLDVENLNDIKGADEGKRSREFSMFQGSAASEIENEKVVVRRRRLVLPPLQVSRSGHSNMNYYRQISAQYREMRAGLNRDNAGLGNIPEEYVKLQKVPGESMPTDKIRDFDGVAKIPAYAAKRSKSTARERQQASSRRKYYEWDYSKPLGPVTVGKYLGDSQKFWRPNESVAVRQSQRIVLPKIS